MITHWQLRSLIANDEAMLEHYAQWLASLEPGQLAPVHLAERIAQTMRRVHARRTVLLNSTLPAAADATISKGVAASLVTTGATPPAPPSSHV